MSSSNSHAHRSRWPLVAALGSGGLYFGFALWLLAEATAVVPALLGGIVAAAGGLGIVLGLAGWTYFGFVTPRNDASTGADRNSAYRATILLFLATDVATFSAGFVYYSFIRVGTWPPAELPPLLGSLVLVNTLLLVTSSFTLHFAHGYLDREQRTGFVLLLGITVVLGFLFLAGQAIEYYEFIVRDGFRLETGIFGSAFYGLTGLHGLHVALGVVFLVIVLFRALRGQYTAERDTSVTTASLYWHFVDAVWLVLVALLYVGATVGA